MKEVIRTTDAENSEENHAKEKFGHETEFVDAKARIAFKTIKMTTLITKRAHGHNHHGERDALMKKEITNQECPRCNEIESQDHVIKCKNTRHMRVEHMEDLNISLMKCKKKKVDEKEILLFVE